MVATENPEQSTSELVSTEALAQRCHEAGMKATPQRIEILRLLVGSVEHPSPETILVDVKKALPSISRGTVYKTLETLEEAGLIRQVTLRFETKRYDGNLSPHHHLICSQCQGVTDFNHPDLDALRPPKSVSGFSPQSMRVQIIGVCAACSVTTED